MICKCGVGYLPKNSGFVQAILTDDIILRDVGCYIKNSYSKMFRFFFKLSYITLEISVNPRFHMLLIVHIHNVF